MFKLNFDIPESSIKINRKDQIYLVGSCFSDSIGSILSGNKFNCLSNPFGTIYNPHSIFKSLRGSIEPDHTIESHGVNYHWDAHGRISGLEKKEVVNQVSKLQLDSTNFLKGAKHLIITLGTSFVYRLNASEQIVANCHKVNSASFSKDLLSVDEIQSEWQKTYEVLKAQNPNLHIIFTVSPVRHVRDGLIENNLSKSILIQAVHRLAKNFDRISYFPSYEILIDELRDYRFFASDLIHPSKEAIHYIWEHFCKCYVDEETVDFLTDWAKMKLALTHKPFQPNSADHQDFLKKTIEKLLHFKDEIDVSKELETLQNQVV